MQSAVSLLAHDLACRRGDRVLFAGLTFALGPGELLLVEGPNGIGKSSLLRLCAGLLRPHDGRVERHGAIAQCDEKLPLDGNKPLGMALDFWRRVHDRTTGELDAACATMELVGLVEVPVAYLSTGQRQRARLARLLLSGAPLWLLDEPANGLDRAATVLLGTAMTQHLQDGGAVLATSHIGLPLEPSARLALAEYTP